jgi:crotonobetainyl-CoA:carnitine CoA-transferase CaiB-like acyl-CoA transferase
LPPAQGAPLLGEHTRQVLHEITGMSDAEIAALEAAGAAKATGA